MLRQAGVKRLWPKKEYSYKAASAAFFLPQFYPRQPPARALDPTPRLRALSNEKNAVTQPDKLRPAAGASGKIAKRKTTQNYAKTI